VRLWIALLALLLVPTPPAVAASPSDSHAPDSPPKLTLVYPSCDSYLSRENAAAQIDGTTVLRFQSDAEGKLDQGAITISSGNAILDAAALACAQDSGVSFDKKPVANALMPALVPAAVRWTRGGHSRLVMGCPFQFISIRLNEEGVAELAIHVSKDGTVTNATIVKSSGYPRVDNAAIACASTFRYQPAMHDGTAVDADTLANVNLKLR
jgi:TonB family protein